MKRANWDYYFNRWMLFLIIFAAQNWNALGHFIEYVYLAFSVLFYPYHHIDIIQYNVYIQHSWGWWWYMVLYKICKYCCTMLIMLKIISTSFKCWLFRFNTSSSRRREFENAFEFYFNIAIKASIYETNIIRTYCHHCN